MGEVHRNLSVGDTYRPLEQVEKDAPWQLPKEVGRKSSPVEIERAVHQIAQSTEAPFLLKKVAEQVQKEGIAITDLKSRLQVSAGNVPKERLHDVLIDLIRKSIGGKTQ